MSRNVEKRHEMPRNVEKCRVLSSPQSGGTYLMHSLEAVCYPPSPTFSVLPTFENILSEFRAKQGMNKSNLVFIQGIKMKIFRGGGIPSPHSLQP